MPNWILALLLLVSLAGAQTQIDLTCGAIGMLSDALSAAAKSSVTVVATSNRTLQGLPIVDGFQTMDASTVLATSQTTGSQNGPWVTHSGAWTRPSWYPSGGTTQAFKFITAQRTTWRLTAPIGTVTIDTTTSTTSAMPSVATVALSAVNIVSSCGAVGDGVTDDLTAINNCISANPARRIVFPKTQAKGVCDYAINGTIVVPWTNRDMVLEGEGGGINNGVLICSLSDATGLLIKETGTTVRGITFRGNSGIVLTDTTTFPTGTSDGIRVCGPLTTLDHVGATKFSRHGIFMASRSRSICAGGTADEGSSSESLILKPWVTNNRADGILLKGIDANVITVIGGKASSNGWFGLQDQASYGGTVINLQTDANHDDLIAATGAVNISSCSVTGGKMTCVTASAHNFINGDVVVIAGSSDSAYNTGTYTESPITVVDATTFTMISGAFGPADGTSIIDGTVAYKPGFRVWAQAGNWGGALYGANGGTVFINVYAESNQPGLMIRKPSALYGGLGTAANLAYYFDGPVGAFTNNTDGGTFDPTNGAVKDPALSGGQTFAPSFNTNTKRLNNYTVGMLAGQNGTATNAAYGVSTGISSYLDFYRTVIGNVDGWWCWDSFDSSASSTSTNGLNWCLSDQNTTAGTGLVWAPHTLFIGGTGPTRNPDQPAIGLTEGSAPTGTSGIDFIWGDSIAHRPKMINHNGSAVQIVGSGGDMDITDHIAANAVTSSKMAIVNTRRTCMILIGADDASAALRDAELGPQKRRCFVPYAATIGEITVSANAGTPSILLQRRRGASTVADLLSGALATAASGNVACAMISTLQTCVDGTTSSNSITLTNTSLNAGDYIELKSGTAGGTAKSLQVAVTFTVN